MYGLCYNASLFSQRPAFNNSLNPSVLSIASNSLQGFVSAMFTLWEIITLLPILILSPRPYFCPFTNKNYSNFNQNPHAYKLIVHLMYCILSNINKASVYTIIPKFLTGLKFESFPNMAFFSSSLIGVWEQFIWFLKSWRVLFANYFSIWI